MDWDAETLTATQEQFLAAVEAQAYLQRSKQPSAGAAPTAADPAAAPQPAEPAPRRRRLPTIGAAVDGPALQPDSAGTGVVVPVGADENLPPACFTGTLRYAWTAYEVDRWCQWLLQESGVAVVGFDIEWLVTYKTGVAPRPVALVQLCYRQPQAAAAGRSSDAPAAGAGQPQQPHRRDHHCCLLLHICHSGLTPYLRQLLCSKKVRRDFGLEMEGVVCLSEYANARLVRPQAPGGSCDGSAGSGAAADPSTGATAAAAGSSCGQLQAAALPAAPQRWSLAGLASLLLRLRLEKSQAVRCSNWEARPPLSGEQQRYAATDAWASLRVHEVLSKLPVVLAPLQPAVAAGSAAPGSGTACSEPATAADDWVAACGVVVRLQPAKLAVYQALVQQGLSVEQVAAMRHIQPDSVQGYMAEAITAGLGYSWSSLGVPATALQQTAGVCGQLLGRELLLQPAPASPGVRQACQVGCKRPPPCSPGSLVVAAAGHDEQQCRQPAAKGDLPAAVDSAPATVQDPTSTAASSGGRPADVLQRLLAAGHKLRDLKERHFEGVSYGQLRLALAHLGRCNPEPWE